MKKNLIVFAIISTLGLMSNTSFAKQPSKPNMDHVTFTLTNTTGYDLSYQIIPDKHSCAKWKASSPRLGAHSSVKLTAEFYCQMFAARVMLKAGGKAYSPDNTQAEVDVGCMIDGNSYCSMAGEHFPIIISKHAKIHYKQLQYPHIYEGELRLEH